MTDATKKNIKEFSLCALIIVGVLVVGFVVDHYKWGIDAKPEHVHGPGCDHEAETPKDSYGHEFEEAHQIDEEVEEHSNIQLRGRKLEMQIQEPGGDRGMRTVHHDNHLWIIFKDRVLHHPDCPTCCERNK